MKDCARDITGLTENDGHENDGPSKLQGMKLQDMKMQDMKIQDMKIQDMKMQDTMSFSNEQTYICVFGDITVTGCWFHFAQSIIKRVNKVGLKDEYMSEPDVQDGIVSLRRFPFSPGLYHFVG